MKISIGKNRYESNLHVVDKTWLDLVRDYFFKVTKTYETAAEYKNMPKADKDNIKDSGGFIGGEVLKGSKGKNNVKSRSMGVLDLDYDVPKCIIETLDKVFDFKFLVYSTHSSTNENLRLRVVIPFATEIEPIQYEPIMRYLAKLVGIEMVDETSFRFTQFMYFCSCPKDIEPLLYESEYENFLDPNEILNKYANWKDISEYQYTNSESATINKKKDELYNDPTTKSGFRGALNRAYTIEEGIDKFLSHVYKKSRQKGRYDYIKAETTGGLVLLSDNVVYSHHSSDPAYGKALDLFGLMQIHLFSDKDDKVRSNTKPINYPSYKKMIELCEKDEKVQVELQNNIVVTPNFNYKCDDWMNKLTRDSATCKIMPTLINLIYIMTNDIYLKSLRYNEFLGRIEISNAPWEKYSTHWVDDDVEQLKVYLSKNYTTFKDNQINTALSKVSTDRHYHPVKEYLESREPWDKVERLPQIFIKYFNAPDNVYTREVAVKIFVAAVARIYEPGIKFDYFPVLCGYQGAYKSTFIAKFAKEWFSDSLSLSDIKDKTAAEKLQGNWFVEAPELSGLKKAEIESIKAFSSRQNDKYRPSYGRVVEEHPRQTIIWGTTNAENGFLRDVTGNRRFFVIKFEGKSEVSPRDITDKDVDAIWAEALYRYRKGEKLTLSDEAEKIAIEVQRDSMETDDREGFVREYLDTLLPCDWESKSIEDRRLFFATGGKGGTLQRKYVTNIEIWTECYGKERSQIKKQDSFEIASIMAKLSNWKATGKPKRFGPYGVNKYYERIEDPEYEKRQLLNGFVDIT